MLRKKEASEPTHRGHPAGCLASCFLHLHVRACIFVSAQFLRAKCAGVCMVMCVCIPVSCLYYFYAQKQVRGTSRACPHASDASHKVRICT